ncbi:MAG: hypothetical protein IT424_14700 [Pirellulales bacterium]|nr:hypothetical protein [Pirellulales bacterium]
MARPRLRCRSRQAAPFIVADAQPVSAVARGVVRHHRDDDWFHQTAAFGELSLELARRVRRVTGESDGMRPSFLGHILVELLLDAAIIDEDPACAARYYAALSDVDPASVAGAVSQMIAADASSLAGIVARFVELQFLYDYLADDSLALRLNQVLRRVRLPALPERFCEILPYCRGLVAAHRDELLTPPSALPPATPAASPLAMLAPVTAIVAACRS